MVDLTALSEPVLARFRAKHEAREAALEASRRSIRASANAIRAAHRNDRVTAGALLTDAEVALDQARLACAGQPDVEHAGFLHDAQKEYAEARTTIALTGDEPLPLPGELGVSDAAYLNGLAETVGELRRSTDVARAIIERTRGDLTSALVQARLRDALDAHRHDVLGG